MKIKKEFMTARCFVYFAVIVIAVIALFTSRVVSVSRIWNGYRVLYVENSVSEDSVLHYLNLAGVEDVITRSAQRVPFTTPFMSKIKQNSDYISLRDKYFFDESLKFNLFYVRDEYERSLDSVLKAIQKETHVKCGLDAHETYPALVPVIVLIVYLLLGVVCQNRFLFLFPSLFFPLLTFSLPFYTVAAASCLTMFAFYLMNRFWRRKSAFRILSKSVYIDILIGASLLLFISEGVKCIVLSALSVSACVCAVLLIKAAHDFKDSRSSFKFSYIFTAKQIPVLHKKNHLYLAALALPVFILLVLCVSSSGVASFYSSSAVSLPKPSENSLEQESVLPNISDYYKWAWYVLSYPYKSVTSLHSDEVKEGDKVEIKRFTQSGNAIKEKTESVMVFNSSFKKDMDKKVAAMDYAAIEKLLVLQNDSISVTYSPNVSTETGSSGYVSLILMVFSLAVPLLLSGVYYIFDRVKV